MIMKFEDDYELKEINMNQFLAKIQSDQ
jgi:hypothetical protein